MYNTKLNRRDFIKKTGLGTVALTFLSGSVLNKCSKENKTPNIIIIYTDDQGYADVGCFGAKGYTTPNLDQMAEDGMKFTDFHVSQAVCSASRAALLTGCYSERVGILGALPPWAQHGLNPKEETIADLLKTQGYSTAMFGKWHLGHEEKFLPLQQGFDEYFGLPYSNDMWPVGYDGKPLGGEKHRKSYYPGLMLIEGNKQTEQVNNLEDQSHLTTRYTDRACSFIEKHNNESFFLYLAHSMPHVPLAVSDKFKGKSEQGLYGDVMMEIDWSVGQVIKTLEEQNLQDNTLVIFTSDNGPWMNFGNHAGKADPLREGKGTMWEGGDRVPCIMKWPDEIPKGTVCDKIASTLDILPTIAAITEAPLPEKKIDGISILSLLKNRKNANPRKEFWYYYGGELRAVRNGDWKLYFPHKSRSYVGVKPGKDGLPGKYAELKVGNELYNLNTDIGEKKNVYKKHPDIVKHLEQIGEQARRELGDYLTNRKGEENRNPGRKNPPRDLKVDHIAIGSIVTLTTQPHIKYSGEGASTIVNGKRGSFDFKDNAWLGFEENNFEALIDLGQRKTIQEIAVGFLESQNSWIFLPKHLSIEVSNDKVNYRTVKKFKQKIDVQPITESKEYKTKFQAASVRYVRIKAQSQKICPDWHPGAGGKTWLFVDEIVIK